MIQMMSPRIVAIKKKNAFVFDPPRPRGGRTQRGEKESIATKPNKDTKTRESTPSRFLRIIMSTALLLEIGSRVAAFERWMKKMEIQWNEDLVQLVRGGVGDCVAETCMQGQKGRPYVPRIYQRPSWDAQNCVTESAEDNNDSRDDPAGDVTTTSVETLQSPQSTARDCESPLLPCTGLGLAIRALKDVKEGQDLCTIPKSACISVRTSSIADVLERERLGGGLGLTVALLHEMSLGTESKWCEYIESMPRREYLPVFWTEAELQSLQGTELEDCAAMDREAMKEDFEVNVAPMPSKYPTRLRSSYFTLDNFMRAASLVASRAFGIDEHHGEAMVPLADIFNHKCSVVELSDDYAVVQGRDRIDDDEDRDDEECDDGDEGLGNSDSDANEMSMPWTGSDSPSPSRRDHDLVGLSTELKELSPRSAPSAENKDGDDEDDEGEEDSNTKRDRTAAIMNRGKEISLHGMTAANGLHLRLEIAIIDRDACLGIVAASDVSSGQEIHNTYGELGTGDLVKKYGFGLQENPFTSVQLDKDTLLQACRTERNVQKLKTCSDDGESSDDATVASQHQKRRRLETSSQRSNRGGKDLDWKDAWPTDARDKQILEETEWLDETEEPFEVYPNGYCSAALAATLRVLCSDGAIELEDALYDPGTCSNLEVSSWGTIQLPLQAQVLRRDGLPPEDAVDAERSLAKSEGCQNDEGFPAGVVKERFMTIGMCEALLTTLHARMLRYGKGMVCCRGIATALDALGRGSVEGIPLEDGVAARRAALVLRLSEIRILQDMMDRVESYLLRLRDSCVY